MKMQFELNDLTVHVMKKRIKNLYLRISSAEGRIQITAPIGMALEAIRLFAFSKLNWIQKKQRQCRSRIHAQDDGLVAMHHAELKRVIPDLIAKWEPIMNVKVERFSTRKMKTRWGSCTPRSRCIRLNTELAKHPLHCLEYVVVHEMVHLLEPSHNQRFKDLMDQFLPDWRLHRAALRSRSVGQVL